MTRAHSSTLFLRTVFVLNARRLAYVGALTVNIVSSRGCDDDERTRRGLDALSRREDVPSELGFSHANLIPSIKLKRRDRWHRRF
jgi:hypothetical protein